MPPWNLGIDARGKSRHDVVKGLQPNKPNRQTPMTPEGASRCRAVASGLLEPVGETAFAGSL